MGNEQSNADLLEAARLEERKRTDEAIRLAHVFRGKVPMFQLSDDSHDKFMDACRELAVLEEL